MEFTGERYIPEVEGSIASEHLHRYILATKLAAGKRVLDIASGEGYGSHMLSRVATHVVGVDVSEEAISHAKAKYKSENLEFRIGSAAAMPVETNSTDLVVSFETIEHHDQHSQMMSEIRRVLKSDGLLIISSPNKQNYSVTPNYSNPYHVKELFLEEFERLLRTYFEHVAIYGQRVVYGSIVASSQKTSAQFSSLFCTNSVTDEVYGLLNPLFDLAVASNISLPDVGCSLLDKKIDGKDAGTYFTEKITAMNQAMAEIKFLQEYTKQIEAEIKCLKNSKSWRITKPLRLIHYFTSRLLSCESNLP